MKTSVKGKWYLIVKAYDIVWRLIWLYYRKLGGVGVGGGRGFLKYVYK